ncbi:MAG: aminotransferase class III-fold pyridoxal phosphate-dependent enzyme [Gemmatimonadetes bacterium]|nr:aminotransferase class III-fold pyridoxal phosphate-dependent enzyme [Gemmatimonadota bacterium]
MKDGAEGTDLAALDRQHHVHPFTDPLDLEDQPARLLRRGRGCWLEDGEGRRVLDAMSGLWCVQVGYGHERLAAVAAEQMRSLPYYNTFFRSTTEPTVRLARKLAELLPGDLNHVFFASSGSEANDTIVRLVRRYWDLAGKPDKKTIISREHAYHGSTLAGASLSGMSRMHQQGDLPLPGFVHVMPPYQYVYGNRGESEEDFGVRAAQALEEKILELGAHRVGAFFGEPVMGAGGVIPPPATYWPEVQRICRKHDVLLVADEVISGFGRTGRWFGIETYGIEPDFVALAKGITSGYIPLSAVVMTARVHEALRQGGVLAHGYTYSGHPVGAAVALENIRLLEDGIVETVGASTGPYLQKRLRWLSAHPLVGEVRGVGLIGGIELARPEGTSGLKAGSRQEHPASGPVSARAGTRGFEPPGRAGRTLDDHAWREGLIIRAMGDTIGVCPPLTITASEIDALVSRLDIALDRTLAGLDGSS